MSLPSYLSKIKSSGIYRFVWDKSEIAGIDAEVLRLVVGYSEKGPFNTPVYVQSASEFVSIFGDISRKLEKRGVFFHRLAKQALAAGPIIALNLKNFDDETVSAFSSAVAGDGDVFTDDISLKVEEIYDTTRFWKLEPEQLHESSQVNDYFAMSATDSIETSSSVFIRGAYTTGYDVTLSDWYNQLGEEMPEYLTDYANLLVSDFLAEVYVFNGQFTKANVTAEPLSKYFNVDGETITLKDYVVNAFGEKVDTLAALSAETASGFVNYYFGVTLPDFKGMNGAYISLDKVFNNDYQKHKLMMDFDGDMLESDSITADSLMTTGWDKEKLFNFIPDQEYVSAGSYDYANKEWKFITDADKEMYGSPKYITYSLLKSEDDPVEFTTDYSEAVTFVSGITAPAAGKLKLKSGANYYDNSPFGAKYKPTAEGVTAITVSLTSTTALELTADDFKAYAFVDSSVTAELSALTAITGGYELSASFGSETAITSVINLEVICKVAGDYTLTVNGQSTAISINTAITDDKFSITALPKEQWEKAGFSTGDRFMVTTGSNVKKLAICANVTDNGDDTISLNLIEAYGESSGTAITSISDAALKKCNASCGVTCKGLSAIYLSGYTYKHSKPESMKMMDKLKWQQFIIEALSKYQGMRIGLTNRTDIDFRYLVDTFEAYVENECHAPFALLCKEKDNALAFINFPAIKTFKSCDYASFTDADGKFQTKYIAEGANKLKNPGVLFSLASEVNGASFASYNTPLLFSDSASASVKINVPSAALVSNNFMQKYLSRQPYYIVAGPNYGRMIYSNLVGPDFNFARTDLDVLEPLGVNCMVYVPRIGTYINSNQTAKQNPVTALSKINVRELVIYLQDEIEKLLQDYQWEFNTPELRNTIKEKADTICSRVKQNGGIYDFINVCDESNNTDDVINNEMIVLSTSIEPGMGAGKMVQELTIYKKGTISSVIK